MATTDYLASPEDLAVWLGVPATDPTLLAALGAASSRFRGAVRHHVSAVMGDVITLDGTGTDTVLLPVAPVTAVTALTLDGEALTIGTDYTWSADGWLTRIDTVWPRRGRCITGTVDHGHDPVPEDIGEVVLDQARALYAVRPGVQSVQVGGQQVTYGAQAAVGVTAQWTTVVERYRLNAGDRA